jgi:hypothetical protein
MYMVSNKLEEPVASVFGLEVTYMTTRCCSQDDLNFNSYCHENLSSQKLLKCLQLMTEIGLHITSAHGNNKPGLPT